MTTQEQLLRAIQRAQAAGDSAAVADLQSRLQGASTPGQGAGVAQPQEANKPFLRPTVPGNSAALAGAGDSAIKAALGLKQFFGGLSEDDKLALQTMQQDESADPEGFKRGAGRVGGNLAMLAIPGGALAKTIQGTRAVQATGAAAPYLATAGTGGATEFATGVGEGDSFGEQMLSKGKQALQAAVLGPILQKTLGMAAKPFTGLFKASPEAEKLIRQGVNPTLQQGAEGRIGKFIGGLTSGATNVRQRQEQEVADALMGRITEGNVSRAQGTGRDYFDAAKDYVSQGYDKLLGGKKYPISPATRSEVAQAASQVNKQGQFLNEADEAGKAVGNVMGQGTGRNINVGHSTLRDEYLGPLSKAAYGSSNDVVRERILAARQVLMDKARSTRLSPEEAARLKQLDSLNFDLQRMREATSGAAGEEMGVNLSRLASSYGKMTNAARSMGNTTEEELIAPATRVLGRTPRQDEARTALVTARRIGGPAAAVAGASLAGGPAGAAGVGAAYGLSALGQTPGGAKFLMGQYDKQRLLAEALRNSPYYGPLAATMGDENAP